jgi:CRISPR-associated protein Csy1
MRLAPVQCAGWGHPVTTGQEAIDFYVTCGEMEPEGADAQYCESLVRLPGIGTRYARPASPSGRSRVELGLPEAGRLYLCPQSLFKIHPDNDLLFARVLAADVEGHLVFFRDHDEPLTAIYQRRLFAVLADVGVGGRTRTVFLDRMGHTDYLQVNALSDVMLDTLHWSGGNTSLDAIAAGLPVVTLPGRFMRGRQSLAMLRRAGLEELIAVDEADYVRIAVRVANDTAWREGLCARLADGSRRVFDDPAPVAALAEFLERAAAPDAPT